MSTQVHPPTAVYFDSKLPVISYLGTQYRQRVGDFLDLGRDQWLSLNGALGGSHRLVDFGSQVPAPVPPITHTRSSGSQLDGFLDPSDFVIAGDFMNQGWDQLFLLNSDNNAAVGQVTIGDIRSPQYATLYWGSGNSYFGWKDSDDRQVAGDFLNLGYDQVLFLNGSPGASGSRAMIDDYSSGTRVTRLLYTPQPSNDILGGWLEGEDQVFAGDFFGLGYDQTMFINRADIGLDASSQGRVMIIDHSVGGGIGAVLYWDYLGDNVELDSWLSSPLKNVDPTSHLDLAVRRNGAWPSADDVTSS
ncbi:MAG: hypothetical protein NXI31_19805, partial [bacterium]|nr:hypothetical protein [bacterium]